MNSKLNKYQLIQDKLKGSLTVEQTAIFNDLLKNDEEFFILFKKEQSLNNLIKGVVKSEISNEIKLGFEREKAKNKNNIVLKIIAGTLVAGIILTSFIYLYKRNKTINSPTTKRTINKTETRKKNNSDEIRENNNFLNNKYKSKALERNPQKTSNPTLSITDTNFTDTIQDSDLKDSNINIQSNNTQNYGEPIIVENNGPQQNKDTINETSLNTPCTNLDSELIVIEKKSPCLFGEKGFIEIEAHGGLAPYIFEINGQKQEDGVFNNLEAKSYTVIVRDFNKCELGKEIFNMKPIRCQNLPLAFDPNKTEWSYETDGDIVKLSILNLAGQEVFSKKTENPSWNGKNFNGQNLKLDGYIFLIYKNGQVIDKGTVTLIRQ